MVAIVCLSGEPFGKSEVWPVAHSGASDAGTITLDQLIALNDEITALVRAKVPLEDALGHLGEDLPGRLGKVTEILSLRMKRGESLSEALENEPEQFPPVYRAVVLAGARAGRLPAALESISGSVRRLAETRRMVAAAFVYPILVALVAWGMFVLFVTWTCPALAEFSREYDAFGHRALANMALWGAWAEYWGPAVPIVVVLLAGVWWLRSGRATLVQPHSAVVTLGWLPWLGRMLRWYQLATFSEVLALLVENRVPLPESVVLSAEATGDLRMIRTAKEVAEALKRGQPLGYRGVRGGGFSPLLDWLMVTGQSHGALQSALRNASELYQRRARHQADVARVFLPVLLTVVIGGAVTFAYALLLFVPWTQALKAISGF